ncbi:hypothetical protein SCHPADRAFT_874504 [Schizopora paradoxa]|uniref:Uncharacterized protein n=1 Tax=Schizopora paradoxa TaxID=27342 RepID=A0A0H2RMI1_9AGAM|nr:hypothetical protein SCHPADRAFT_874504 [Schizopora paradoxa]
MDMSTTGRLLVMLAILISLRTPPVYSQSDLFNITIDDSFADPSTGVQIFYGLQNRPGEGNGWAPGQDCPGCLAQPNKTLAFNNSWHDTTYSAKGDIPYAWMTFTGSAVYVMGIVIASMKKTSTSLNNTRLSFEIDGEDQGTYLHVASIGSDIVYSYDTLFFAKEDLPFDFHNITIMVGNSVDNQDSLCLLDRIIYTTKTNSGPIVPSSPPVTSFQHTATQSSDSSIFHASESWHPSTEKTIIIALGSVLLLLAASGIYILRLRRKRTLESIRPTISQPEASIGDTPDVDPPSYLDSTGVSSQTESNNAQRIDRGPPSTYTGITPEKDSTISEHV